MAESKAEQELAKALALFGLTLLDISNRPSYRDRKGQIFGVFDSEKMLCSYSNVASIKKWAYRKLTSR